MNGIFPFFSAITSETWRWCDSRWRKKECALGVHWFIDDSLVSAWTLF